MLNGILQLHHLGVMLGYKIAKCMIDPQRLVFALVLLIYILIIKIQQKRSTPYNSAHQDSKSCKGSSDAVGITDLFQYIPSSEVAI